MPNPIFHYKAKDLKKKNDKNDNDIPDDLDKFMAQWMFLEYVRVIALYGGLMAAVYFIEKWFGSK